MLGFKVQVQERFILARKEMDYKKLYSNTEDIYQQINTFSYLRFLSMRRKTAKANAPAKPTKSLVHLLQIAAILSLLNSETDYFSHSAQFLDI